jgi:hypothetical protein
MWNPNIRPHGEYFAVKQSLTTSAVVGNQVNNSPMRLENSQGGTAIRVAVPLDATLVVPNNGTVTLTVYGRLKQGDAASTATTCGTAVYTNSTGASLTLGPDATLCEFVLPQNVGLRPWVHVAVQGSAAHAGQVDVFPHKISHPGR